MKKILTILSLFITATVFAAGPKNFYISAGGNNGNDGLTKLTSWQTIAKVNSSMSLILAGDSILFKSGDSFYGSIVITKSGVNTAPIVISSYGTGAKPIITGLITLTGWTLISTGIYEVTAPAKSSVNMVTMNGIPQRVGRFPNPDAANGGYLTYTAYSGNTTLTASALGATNWTGAEVVARKEGFLIERDIITNQTGATITYAALPTINPRNNGSSLPTAHTPPKPGFGLFIQRDVRTLDQLGEWFFKTSTGKLQMYFGGNNPSDYEVKISTLDTLIKIGTSKFITVANLTLEGANLAAIFFTDAAGITVKNCDINYSGAKGVFGWNTGNVVINSCNFNWAMCSSIDLTGRIQVGATVTNNRTHQVGTFPGMGSFYDDVDYKNIYVSVKSSSRISKNRLDTSGFVGIQFQGQDVLVDSNYINYFCFVKDDGGGIYTFLDITKKNRTVAYNIILNGIGAPDGNQNPIHAEGIYGDGQSTYLHIIGNTVANVSNRAIYNNDPQFVTIENNTTYGGLAWSGNKHYDANIQSYTVKNNIFFYGAKPPGNDQTYFNNGVGASTTPATSTIQTALQQLGDIDSNYYHIPTDDVFYWYWAPNSNHNSFTFVPDQTFATWKSYTGHDANSVRIANGIVDTLYYNSGNGDTTINFIGRKKIDARGTVYENSATITPFNSLILMDNGTATTTNIAPVAHAGGDQIIYSPASTVNLAGSGTDAGAITYAWVKITGPAGETIVTPALASTLVNNLIEGEYEFELTVTDDQGAIGKDRVHVSVASVPPVDPSNYILLFNTKILN